MAKQHLRDTYELLFDSSSGDIEAYKELFERYSEKLYNFVYYLTYSREESEDITSEAFIKVFEALQGRDVTSFNFQAYLYKTARNLSLKAIERRKREGLTLDEAMDLEDPALFSDPEKASLLSEQRLKVKDASGRLTEDQQAALLLKELEGFPYDTIAEVLDSNPNAVGVLLSRARLKFREVYRMTHAQTEGIPDTCAKITPLLSSYIDGEASPEQKQTVEAHLASCPICNANLESMRDASITYRGLVPILPLATLKVWGSAQSALVGGKVAAWAGASAEAGTAAAGAATTTATGIISTIASSMAYKVAAIVVAGLVAIGIGVGGYFAVTRVASKPKGPVKSTGKAETYEWTLKFQPKGRMYGIYAYDATHVWAGGDNNTNNGGIIYFFDGSSWRSQYESELRIKAIWAAGPSKAWAIGFDAVDERGDIYYFDGKSWTKQYEWSEGCLTDISGTDKNHIWAVGNDVILFYDGKSWTKQFSSGNGFNSVSALNRNHVWAACRDGNILFYNGSSWMAQGHFFIGSLYAVNPNCVWAVGDEIYLFNGKSWAVQYEADIPYQAETMFFDVYALNRSNVWANSNSNIWLFNNGVDWIKEDSHGIISMSAVSKNKVWGAGDAIYLGSTH